MNEEILINLVKEHGELYDLTHRLYQDQTRRDLAWKMIAQKMKTAAHECKDRWKKLRENYRKAMKLRQIQKEKGMKKLKPIKHGRIMSFIDDRKETECEQENQSTSFTRKPERNPDPAPVDPLTVIERFERNYETAPKNTVITFFINLGETVKTFPEEVQIRVKRDIFKIVNEAEEEVVANKLQISQVRSYYS